MILTETPGQILLHLMWCEEGYCVDSTGKIVSFQP